jgi:MFS family permease
MRGFYHTRTSEATHNLMPVPRRNVAVSLIMILGVLVGAGGVPPLIGFLADSFSFPLAFGMAGPTTSASPLLLGLFPSRKDTPRTDDEKKPSAFQ